MQITKDYLLTEIQNMEKQRNHAHDVAVASQAAIDVMSSLVSRLDLPEETELKFSDLGLSDPVPVDQIK